MEGFSHYLPAFTDLNQGFVVAITIEAKDDEAEAVALILQELVQPTMNEAGVKFFIPYRSPTNRSLFFVYELYVDEKGWEAHQESEHFQAAVNELIPRVLKRERIAFVPYV